MARTKAKSAAKTAGKKSANGANVGYEAELWKMADALRGSMDAAEYKHVVLGLIFLKYISDAFEEQHARLQAETKQGADPEDPDEYRAHNIFWVPPEARWPHLKAQARQTTIGQLVDDAMTGIERDNPSLKSVLPKDYARPALDKTRLGQLIDLISNISFLPSPSGRGIGGEGQVSDDRHAHDLLGRIYEYFLSRFANAEGKKGGEFYTPRCVVKLLVEMLEPYKGRVYDPCCGSSGMFVQAEEFIKAHRGKLTDLSIFGQESNYTTWRLAKMNLAIRGIEGRIEHGDTFHNDRHPDLKADFILANPPFNVSDWGGERLKDDKRWQYGIPPKGNANFGWVQHIVHHLAPAGTAGFVLANGSMSSNQSGEGEIRKNLIEADLVDCMIALPGQLFYSTQIPACLWFVARDRAGKSPSPRSRGEGGRRPGEGYRDRRGEILFMDARKLGRMVDRTHRELTDEDIARIAGTYHAWRGESLLPSPSGRGAGGEGRGEGKDNRWQLPSTLLENARELRTTQTDAESLLWRLLRNRQLADCKFRRQHPVGNYILDFYCHDARLAIELDGGQHDEPDAKARDAVRTVYLKDQGIRVLRFWNNEVLQQTEAVLERIYDTLTQTLSQRERARTPVPSPSGRGVGGEGRDEGIAVYRDIPGFCKSAPLEEVRKHGHVLTPGRYVGAEAQEEDAEPFEEKMQRLVKQLREQQAEAAKLDVVIAANLKGLGYGE